MMMFYLVNISDSEVVYSFRRCCSIDDPAATASLRCRCIAQDLSQPPDPSGLLRSCTYFSLVTAHHKFGSILVQNIAEFLQGSSTPINNVVNPLPMWLSTVVHCYFHPPITKNQQSDLSTVVFFTGTYLCERPSSFIQAWTALDCIFQDRVVLILNIFMPIISSRVGQGHATAYMTTLCIGTLFLISVLISVQFFYNSREPWYSSYS